MIILTTCNQPSLRQRERSKDRVRLTLRCKERAPQPNLEWYLFEVNTDALIQILGHSALCINPHVSRPKTLLPITPSADHDPGISMIIQSPSAQLHRRRFDHPPERPTSRTKRYRYSCRFIKSLAKILGFTSLFSLLPLLSSTPFLQISDS